MKKIILLGLLSFFGYKISCMEQEGSVVATPYGNLLEFFRENKDCVSKNIAVMIGSSLQKERINCSISEAFSSNDERSVFILFGNKERTHLHYGPILQTVHYNNKQFNVVNECLEKQLLFSNHQCKAVVVYINKDSMCFDRDLQMIRMRNVITVMQKPENKSVSFCFLVDEEGLDSRAYPLLEFLCNKLEAEEPSGCAGSHAPHETCEFMFMNQKEFGLSEGVDTINRKVNLNGRSIYAEQYLIEIKNRCMPFTTLLYNVAVSKVGIMALLLISAYALYAYQNR